MSLRSALVSNRGSEPSAGPHHDRLPPPTYFSYSNGSVYYTPRRHYERRRRLDSGDFPAPLIEPRQRRPHSIHIVSYPSGFVPHELRPDSQNIPYKKSKGREKREGKKALKKEEKERKKAEKERNEKQEKRRSLRSLRSLPPGSEKVGRVIDKIFAAFSIAPRSSSPVSASPAPNIQPRPSSFISFARRLSRIDPTTVAEAVIVEEQVPDPGPPNMAGTIPNPPTSGVMAAPNRNSIMSIRSAKTVATSSVSEIQKPVASGSGLSCSILLAEPNVFLSGFDHDHRSRRGAQATSALLRGKLQLNVSKNVKIKSVAIKLVGKARTEWPEGIPPLKTEIFEEQTLRTQSLLFFHAMHEGMWDTEYGSQCTYTHKSSSNSLRQTLQHNPPSGSIHILGKGRAPSTLTAKELRKLSLQSVNSRSFGKGESPLANQVQAKGYKIFRPGTYEYAFELPIDHNQLETAKLQYGSIRWALETTVERAGAFKPNLHGTKEVSIVRLPDQMSLEMSEPISISRHWEDQLHYDIVISGKSFPIGGRMPIAFKLTPLAKVQIHKLKVFVTESIEYWTNDRHVTRKDPGRKLLLLEKTAGKPLDKQFAASDVRVLSGGELEPDQREEARRTAARRRLREASRTHRSPEPLPEPADNILGDLDLGLETFWGSTEIEMNVQLPTCEMMARDKSLRLHPDCSWKNVNVYHWIKLVMRISRADPEDPTGKKRRHFEISIDSPFTVLNCRATQANTALPQYSGRDGPVQRQQMTCGCPDAQPIDLGSTAAGSLALVEEDLISPGGRRLRLDFSNSAGLPGSALAAHLHHATSIGARQSASLSRARAGVSPMEQERPIHLIRHPSHNPPAFDADEPPPPLPSALLTPPPHYDLIVGTPSVDGLADYFARLAAYENTNSSSQSDTDTPGTSTTRTDPTTGQVTSVNLADDTVDPFSNMRFPPPSTPSGEANAATEGEAGECVDAETEAGGEPERDDDASSSASDSAEDDLARPHRRGRVNVANPRTPGGRMVPSRSLEIERPVLRLDMSGVLRRRAG